MILLARLDETTLRTLLEELLPITIWLDAEADGLPNRDGRSIRIDPAQSIDFVAGEGLRLVTGGKIRWIAAGVPFEATLLSVQLMLRPQIVPDKHGGRLVFRPQLEAADLKNVPAFIDRGVVSLVNRQLEARADEAAWDFGRTLGIKAPVPPTLEGVSSLALDVRNANLQIFDDAIELGLTIAIDFMRSGQEVPATPATTPPATPPAAGTT